METPDTFSLVLKAARLATILDWSAVHASISIFIDDIPGDRRTVINVHLKTKVVDLKTLSGYDAKKNAWRGYCEPSGHVFLKSGRGQKELRNFLRSLALHQNKWLPNPATLTAYDVPKIIAEMESK